MQILLLTNVFPNPWAPTKGAFNFELARALARRGEVRVICPIPWTDELRPGRGGVNSPAARVETREGIEIHYPRYYFPPKIGRRYYAEFLDRSVRGAVDRVLTEFTPQAVVGYWAHPDGAVAVRTARRAGAKAVVMVGGSDVLLLTRDRGRRRAVLGALHGADCMIPVSRHLAEQLVQFGLPPKKIEVVYRGVDAARFAPGDRRAARRRLGLNDTDRIALWAGRMVPVKGLDVLIEACRIARERNVSMKLYLVGDGPLAGSLATAARSAGLGGMVHFVGAASHDALADWYRAADCTVLSSLSEGVPNVLLESHACGTPFVASRVGGVPEIAVDGVDRLVPPGDGQALAAALADMLSGDRADGEMLAARVPSLETAADALIAAIDRSPGVSTKDPLRREEAATHALVR